MGTKLKQRFEKSIYFLGTKNGSNQKVVEKKINSEFCVLKIEQSKHHLNS
jgi:UDP-N-acetyl-D-mannosaminuronic acid transferase (WecB/TagA/CpsF family)